MSTKLLKSKRYPNLFRDKASGTYIFRKYSTLKKKQFNRSTGERTNESLAYKKGLDSFNTWIGKVTDEQGVVYFDKYARRYLKRKLEDKTLAKSTKAAFRNQLEPSENPSGRADIYRPRLIDGLGHQPIDKITNETWIEWVEEIRQDFPELKFFNARKALIEILGDAYRNQYINRVPEFDTVDGKSAPPRELTREEVGAIFKACHYVEKVRGPKGTTVPRRRKDRKAPLRYKNWIKLLLLWIWKMGARPGEILQYQWSMIRWNEGPEKIAGRGPVGVIYIPGEITKTRRSRSIPLDPAVRRVLNFLRARKAEARSRFIFPSEGNSERPMGSYARTLLGVSKRAGFHLEIYWFRDTFVTTKHREGKSLLSIARYIDSSVKVLQDRYAITSHEDLGELL